MELDQALLRFQSSAPEYSGGLSNHGPMVAEALDCLGHEALISAWVDVYAPRLDDRVEGRPIPLPDQAAAMGVEAFADWRATFEVELAGAPWRGVLRGWLPILLPGYFAAGMHGPIRVSHAVRALEADENPIRLGELAAGLGYWASRFQRLPGEPGVEPRPGFGPLRVLEKVPITPAARRRKGFLVDAVSVLEDDENFARTIGGTDLETASPGDLIGEICARAAHLYIANPSARIAYIHMVTGTAALRLVSGYVDDQNLRRGVGYALQATAALHSTHCEPLGVQKISPDSEETALSWDELRYRAACSLEEHTIKLTEACWREDRIRPSEFFQLAAADAVKHLGASWGGRGG
ncbi:MAG TPA: hypothetical protein EYQ54_07295 [Myxococcales bacterium]|nr:hypothetical protein [Myxococcales bacterium]